MILSLSLPAPLPPSLSPALNPASTGLKLPRPPPRASGPGRAPAYPDPGRRPLIDWLLPSLTHHAEPECSRRQPVPYGAAVSVGELEMMRGGMKETRRARSASMPAAGGCCVGLRGRDGHRSGCGFETRREDRNERKNWEWGRRKEGVHGGKERQGRGEVLL
eukprot:385322-Rhodomonas_salina.1